MGLKEDYALTIFEIRNQEELVLDIVKRLPDSMLFAHEVTKLLISMYVVNPYHQCPFLLLPLLFAHFLIPMHAKLNVNFGPTFVQIFCFCVEVLFHFFKIKGIKIEGSKNI